MWAEAKALLRYTVGMLGYGFGWVSLRQDWDRLKTVINNLNK